MIFDLDPTLRWAFCMTHPDDEISIGAWMRRLRMNGNQVFLSWTHSNPIREAEGRAVAALLDIPAENLRFWEAPDGDVVSHVADLIPKFHAWFKEIEPDRVCCGAFEQGHVDHDATNFIVHQAFNGPVFEIPFYHTYLRRLQTINRFADPRGQEVITLETQEKQFKKLLAKQYPSQNIWSVLLWYEVWQRSRLRMENLIGTERMRLQTHKNFLEPNVSPKIKGRILAHPTWRRWSEKIRPLLSA